MYKFSFEKKQKQGRGLMMVVGKLMPVNQRRLHVAESSAGFRTGPQSSARKPFRVTLTSLMLNDANFYSPLTTACSTPAFLTGA